MNDLYTAEQVSTADSEGLALYEVFIHTNKGSRPTGNFYEAMSEEQAIAIHIKFSK